MDWAVDVKLSDGGFMAISRAMWNDRKDARLQFAAAAMAECEQEDVDLVQAAIQAALDAEREEDGR